MKETEGIVISRIEQSPFTIDDVIELMHESFEEHLDEGLHFTCSTMTAAQFLQKTRGSIVFVAWREGEQQLLGTATLTIRRDARNTPYGYNEYNAVSPKAKRLGIGTRLLRERVCVVLSQGGQYILSDTATAARSSVGYHLKNGFKIVGMESYPSTNYYSYLFRKQLRIPSIWNCNIYVRLRFLWSAFRCKSIKRANGEYTLLGRVLKRVKSI